MHKAIKVITTFSSIAARLAGSGLPFVKLRIMAFADEVQKPSLDWSAIKSPNDAFEDFDSCTTGATLTGFY